MTTPLIGGRLTTVSRIRRNIVLSHWNISVGKGACLLIRRCAWSWVRFPLGLITWSNFSQVFPNRKTNVSAIISRDQNIIRNGNIKIVNLSYQKVEKFKYLEAIVTNISNTREEIKRRINMGNVWYYSVEKLLSSSLLSKQLKVRIYMTVILPVILYGCETWTPTVREEQSLRMFENEVLKKIFVAKKDEVTGEWKSYTTQNIKSRR
ncbi:hypothetical protein ANN_15441 [Periplaneta americana]|uniref:Uncharacterized protein n=1 Tax=Periplaneta americana TaxID=6978 RepID=A0ABQ8SGD9_PERAM|nr:hypothetical protein ANN_15441 [Periplaneta americana]